MALFQMEKARRASGPSPNPSTGTGRGKVVDVGSIPAFSPAEVNIPQQIPELRPQRRTGFHTLDNEVPDYYLPLLGAPAFALYVCLARRSWGAWVRTERGDARVSERELARWTGMSRSTVQRSLAILSKAGLIWSEPARARTGPNAKRRLALTNIKGRTRADVEELAAPLAELRLHLWRNSEAAPTKLSVACEWLSKFLESGPKVLIDLRQSSELAGHSWMTIRRAKAALNVRSAKASYQGQVVWNLPKGAHAKSKGAQINAPTSEAKNPSVYAGPANDAQIKRANVGASTGPNSGPHLLDKTSKTTTPPNPPKGGRRFTRRTSPASVGTYGQGAWSDEAIAARRRLDEENERRAAEMRATFEKEKQQEQQRWTAKPQSTEAAEMWKQISAILQKRTIRQSFETWIQPVKGWKLSERELFVRIPSPEFEHIGDKYPEQITAAIGELELPIDCVRFVDRAEGMPA